MVWVWESICLAVPYLPVVVGEVQRPLRGGQRDIDDGCVEHDHQLREAEDREDRPAALVVGVDPSHKWSSVDL